MPSEQTVCMGITQQLTELLQTVVWVSSPVGSIKGDKNTGNSGQTLEPQHVSITSFMYYVYNLIMEMIFLIISLVCNPSNPTLV